jgi:hypothetical protein
MLGWEWVFLLKLFRGESSWRRPVVILRTNMYVPDEVLRPRDEECCRRCLRIVRRVVSGVDRACEKEAVVRVCVNSMKGREKWGFMK